MLNIIKLIQKYKIHKIFKKLENIFYKQRNSILLNTKKDMKRANYKNF